MKNVLWRIAGCVACVSLLVAAPSYAQIANPNDQPVTRSTFRDVSKRVSPAVANIKIKSNFTFGPKGPARGGKAVIPPGFGLDDEMREMLERLFEQQMPYMTPQDAEEYKYARAGSGVMISPDGYIVTSHHVIDSVKEEDIEVTLPDGRSFDKVKIAGTDEITDLALLKVEGSGLPTIPWGDSDKLEVGDIVMAIGNPLEFNNSVSEGIVSAKHRVIKKAPVEDLIQTTAMINPGNSGGALVDLDGKLIGINMAIATSTNMWSGIGFAIPSRTVKDVAEQIIARGKVPRGYLGIEMERLTNSLAHQLGYNQNYGIVVAKVRPGTAADRAGLQRYDIIAKVNGKEIREINDMHRTIAARNAGETVDVEIYRDEGSKQLAQKTVKVQLDERPSQEELEKLAPSAPEPPGQKPSNPTLGLKVRPSGNGSGVVVEDVESRSRAAVAGIQKDDVILQVNRKDVNNEQDLQKAVREAKDDEHLLLIERKGKSAFVTISAE